MRRYWSSQPAVSEIDQENLYDLLRKVVEKKIIDDPVRATAKNEK